MRKFVTVATTLNCIAVLAGGADQSQDPTALSLAGPGLQAGAVKFWEAGATLRWNA